MASAKKEQHQGILLKQVDNIVAKVEEVFTVVVFVCMLTLMVVQVFARYVFMYPLPWSEELIRSLFVPASFVGAALAAKRRAHIDITLINSVLGAVKNEKIRKTLDRFIWLAADASCLVVLSIFGSYTFKYMETMIVTSQHSPAMNMPMGLVVGAMFAGVVLMVLHYAVKLIQNIIWGGVQESEGGH